VPRQPRRVAVLTSASGSGGTTFGRELAARLGAPFYELDALFWKPNWTESSAEELRALVEPLVACKAWVMDGSYQSKLGDLVLRNADLVVWLDLPIRVWFPRLLRRTVTRVLSREELWAGNHESLRNVFFSRDSLLLFTIRWYGHRRRVYPTRLAPFRHVRLRSPAEIERFLRGL